jgi:transcriptional regulator NrdR family protein
MEQSTLANQNHIVKRAGHSEPYDQRKLYASVYSALLSVREPAASAELVAERICQDVEVWLTNKAEVTSSDISRNAYNYFKVLNPDAAWIYLHQRNVS